MPKSSFGHDSASETDIHGLLRDDVDAGLRHAEWIFELMGEKHQGHNMMSVINTTTIAEVSFGVALDLKLIAQMRLYRKALKVLWDAQFHVDACEDFLLSVRIAQNMSKHPWKVKKLLTEYDDGEISSHKAAGRMLNHLFIIKGSWSENRSHNQKRGVIYPFFQPRPESFWIGPFIGQA